MKISLTNDELYSILEAMNAVEEGYDIRILKQEKGYYIYVDKDTLSRLRDDCGEYLGMVGFDSDYKLTQKGEVLENLIDRFFPLIES